MANEEIRVGLIGAGRNTRERHIPGFQKIQGLEIAAVANRSQISGRAVADQFNIPTVYDNWQELLEAGQSRLNQGAPLASSPRPIRL